MHAKIVFQFLMELWIYAQVCILKSLYVFSFDCKFVMIYKIYKLLSKLARSLVYIWTYNLIHMLLY